MVLAARPGTSPPLLTLRTFGEHGDGSVTAPHHVGLPQGKLVGPLSEGDSQELDDHVKGSSLDVKERRCHHGSGDGPLNLLLRP